MTILDRIKELYSTCSGYHINQQQFELTQLEIDLLYVELWKEFDYQAMMLSDGIDRINSVLQRIGLPNIKLKKMEKQRVKYTIEVPEGMYVEKVIFKPLLAPLDDELFIDFVQKEISSGSEISKPYSIKQ